MMSSNGSIVGASSAVRTTAIPDSGRKVSYRSYLIHAEIPGLCYVIYGRNRLGQLAELGTARDFRAAMEWVDRHRCEMRRLMPVVDPQPVYPDSGELSAVA